MGRRRKKKDESFLEKKMTRREFVKLAGLGVASLGVSGYYFLKMLKTPGSTDSSGTVADFGKFSREASNYLKLGNNVHCQLCPHKCLLEDGERGNCRTRENRGGTLYTLAYGNPCAVHVDPIEKKPLFHVLPATGVFSIATGGCNLRCKNCQNWQISQKRPEDVQSYELFPEQVVREALAKNCRSIAYTYSEPIAFYEYMYDTAKLARENNILNLWITAGYINPEPLSQLCKYIDAANVDLKGFDDRFYAENCGGTLEPVLETLKVLKREKVWFEITNLVIPTVSDDMGMIRRMCEWIHDNLGGDYPLHFSRFTPMYQLANLSPTPKEALVEARKIAIDCGLDYVYIGNVRTDEGQNTYCPKCGKMVIERKGFFVGENNVDDGACKFCGEKIAGVWE